MFDQMAVNKETSNAVNIDWENALHQLTLYAKNKLYKRVGPLLIRDHEDCRWRPFVNCRNDIKNIWIWPSNFETVWISTPLFGENKKIVSEADMLLMTTFLNYAHVFLTINVDGLSTSAWFDYLPVKFTCCS